MQSGVVVYRIRCQLCAVIIKEMKKLLLLIFLFAGSCEGSDTPGASGQRYVQGKVPDMKGNPVAGARIIVDNAICYNSGTTTDVVTTGFR